MDFSSKAFYDCMADVVEEFDESESGIRMRKFNEEDAEFYIEFMRKHPSLRRLQ